MAPYEHLSVVVKDRPVIASLREAEKYPAAALTIPLFIPEPPAGVTYYYVEGGVPTRGYMDGDGCVEFCDEEAERAISTLIAYNPYLKTALYGHTNLVPGNGRYRCGQLIQDTHVTGELYRSIHRAVSLGVQKYGGYVLVVFPRFACLVAKPLKNDFLMGYY